MRLSRSGRVNRFSVAIGGLGCNDSVLSPSPLHLPFSGLKKIKKFDRTPPRNTYRGRSIDGTGCEIHPSSNSGPLGSYPSASSRRVAAARLIACASETHDRTSSPAKTVSLPRAALAARGVPCSPSVRAEGPAAVHPPIAAATIKQSPAPSRSVTHRRELDTSLLI